MHLVLQKSDSITLWCLTGSMEVPFILNLLHLEPELAIRFYRHLGIRLASRLKAVNDAAIHQQGETPDLSGKKKYSSKEKEKEKEKEDDEGPPLEGPGSGSGSELKKASLNRLLN